MKGKNIGKELYDFASELFPICRSITGNGVRKTLEILKRELPALVINEIPTGTRCFDWTVPDEWNVRDAFILDPRGYKIVDFKKNNLHLLSYSEPVDLTLTLEDLKPHLYTDPSRPDSIPYRTSYYEKRWGFCLPHTQFENLEPGSYKVFIDSSLKKGILNYGEMIIPGKCEEEIFLSTYICHPSMANNETSGIVVTAYITKWLLSLDNLKRTYRIVFIPETIGSICYLSKNIEVMKRNIVAGFNVTCVGDDRSYSYIKSRRENTLADRTADHVVKNIAKEYKVYPFLKSGSDERQYCSPGVDLPVVSIMRSKYAEYPEYHSSLDNMDMISPSGLFGGYRYIRLCLECLERNEYLRRTSYCQPQLGKRGLYPNLSTANLNSYQRRMVDLLAYSDGRDLLEIANQIDVEMWKLFEIVDRLKMEGLIEVVSMS